MTTVLLVIHLLIAIALVILVLLQPSEGGGLGIGGGGGGGSAGIGGFLSGRGTANLLTRTTAVLAAVFMATSIALTMLAGGGSQQRSILDEVPETSTPESPGTGAAGSSSEPGADTGGQNPEVPVQ